MGDPGSPSPLLRGEMMGVPNAKPGKWRCLMTDFSLPEPALAAFACDFAGSGGHFVSGQRLSLVSGVVGVFPDTEGRRRRPAGGDRFLF